MPSRLVLGLNCGSSSLKFGLYRSDGKRAEAIAEGEAEEIGKNEAALSFKRGNEPVLNKKSTRLTDHAAALASAFELLDKAGLDRPEAVGHRFVHGGPKLVQHQLVRPAVAAELESAAQFAPLHMPAALATLLAAQQRLPDIPQVACFDTAFHRDMPPVSKTFALPAEVRELGVMRYGFHGISIESILEQIGKPPPRLIVAHLGSGASVTAVQDGKSLDTTMGLTPTGGIMMGTRPGDLDPGLLVFLLRHGWSDPAKLEQLLDHESGLLGVSGLTSDVRELSVQRKANSHADLALTMFCYQVRKSIAAMAAALGGVDEIVFTGGIGEHAADIREEICSGLSFLGSNFETRVLPSQENLQIARITARLVRPQSESL